jgi:WD40 repeat protein
VIRSFLLFCLSLSISVFAQTHPVEVRSLLVCGGTLVHLVDPAQSKNGEPHIIWTWNAREVKDLPDQYRNRYFNSVDDVKPVRGGSQLLISSSSGGVVLWDLKENRSLFHAYVPNAHSIELLPSGLIAAAASTHKEGNLLMLFDPAAGDGNPVATDALHSAHGVVWHEKRQTLFALGFDVLREYQVESKTLRLLKEWKIPGESGHDLTLSPDSKTFFLTEHTGAWQFDLEAESFSAIPGFPNAENIKSLNLAHNGQYLYTVPEESWWTYHVSLHRPDQRLAFPGMKVYKARWYRE